MFRSAILLSLTVFAGSLFEGCTKEKEIIEFHYVLTKEDRSLPQSLDIEQFDMLSADSIYLIAGSPYSVSLYRSFNGGVTWETFNCPNSNAASIHSITFRDAQFGCVVLNERMYVTGDGGQSWVIMTNQFGLEAKILFTGKNSAGDIFYIEEDPGSVYGLLVKKIPAGDIYPVQIAAFTVNNVHFYGGRLSGSHMVLFSDFNYMDGYLHAFNLSTMSPENLSLIDYNGYNLPNDACFEGPETIFARQTGILQFYEPGNPQFYQYHDRDYEGICYLGNYYVAVGDQTVSSNIGGEWREIMPVGGGIIQGHLMEVRRIDDSHFYACGKDGLFFKGTLE